MTFSSKFDVAVRNVKLLPLTPADISQRIVFSGQKGFARPEWLFMKI